MNAPLYTVQLVRNYEETQEILSSVSYIFLGNACQANKVNIFCKGHKILRNNNLIFDASWQLKRKGKVISQKIFAAL